jgi:2-polyprenyl-6-methoxyphenol hydroxylase-like FAD-dependent oxidoreductase
MRALIIGGGIGGLSAAIALRGVGIDTTVYERSRELREIGAGLSLWPNALAALDRLGLGDAVRRVGPPGQIAGALRNPAGKALQRVSRDTQVTMTVLHRAELQTLMLAMLPRDVVCLGAACTGFEQDAEGVTAHFAGQLPARGDVLIAADGIRSVIRGQLHGGQPPRYAGYIAWRGVTEFDLPPHDSGETWGRGTRFGMIPMNRGRVYWFAVANAPELTSAEERDPLPGRKERLLTRFRGWHAPIEALIASTEETAILVNDIADLPPLKSWGAGRVTLLGDAAHATTPNLGQGGCQAIEDAVSLAYHLTHAADVVPALAAYEAERIPRTTRISQLSRQLGAVAQWQNPLLCRVRDFVMGIAPASLQERQLASVVTYPEPGVQASRRS